MSSDEEEDRRPYQVVVNAAGQYSIWFDASPAPSGWTATGKTGSKAECLSYIEEVWVDMRPRPHP